MKQSPLTFGELLEHSNLQPSVNQVDKDKILEYLVKQDQLPSEPIYIKILIGVGAWFASGFLLIFVGMFIGFSQEIGAVLFGIGFLVGSILIAKASKMLFLSQVSLVMALAGNVLTVVGIAMLIDQHELYVAFFVHTIVCAIVYPLFNNSFYRFLAPLAFVVFSLACIFDMNAYQLIHLLIFVEMILFGFLITHKKLPVMFAPLTLASACMLPTTLLFLNLAQVNSWLRSFNEPLLPSSIFLTGGLIYLYFNLAGSKKKRPEPWMVLTIISTILLGIITTPGILVAIGLLIIGYAYDDRILTTLSYLFLISFLVIFYYALSISLYEKSLIISGSGILLLILRWAASRYEPKGVTL